MEHLQTLHSDACKQCDTGQKNSYPYQKAASYREKSQLTGLFTPHEIQFVIWAGCRNWRLWGDFLLLRFKGYHKHDTIIGTFKRTGGILHQGFSDDYSSSGNLYLLRLKEA